MKIPPPSTKAIRRFEALLPSATQVEVRKVFGQPSAFLGGNMFFGVFGDQLFLRLGESEREGIKKLEGAKTFEPMPGRAMSEYVTLPEALLEDPGRLGVWMGRSIAFVSALPPKVAKGKSVAAKKTARSPKH